MPIPNLIHPIDVKLEQIDKASTFYDEDAREEIQIVNRASTVTLKGQVKWDFEMSLSAHKGGAGEDASGYVLFRFVDLDALSIEIKRGDRFVEFGGREANVYVIRTQPTATYDDVNGATLLKAFFSDRQPSEN
jgi:hypothetical protein